MYNMKQENTNVKDQNKRKKIIYLILGLLVIVQLGLIIYEFAYKKEGYHSDELWSYGYANSYYQKDIFQDENGQLIHYGEWTDAQVLEDYLTVNKGEEFKYDSVYKNQINDLSPPLHSMVLHTICSFFPERFSPWYSFFINIAAFIISMIFLFKLGQLLKGDIFALSCCVLYGFSWGARDTFIYLRMYAMCTALVMIFVYNLIAYIMEYDKHKKIFSVHLLTLCPVALIGFLTHYYMISFIGVLTFTVCVMLLCQKKIKQMFTYGFSMLAMLMVSIMVFPSLLRVSQNQGKKVASDSAEMLNYTFEMRFRIMTNFITRKMFNVETLYKSGYLRIAFGVLLFILIVSIPLMFLLRETAFMKRRVRNAVFVITHVKSVVKYCLRRIRWIYIVMLVTIVLQVIVVGESSNVYLMGSCADRYIMYLYPLSIVIALALISWITRLVIKNKKIRQAVFWACVILLAGMNLYNRKINDFYYFKTYVQGETLQECLENRDCIYIMDKAWLLTAYAPYFMNADQYFEVSRQQYAMYEEEYKEKLKEKKVVLVIDSTFLSSVGSYLEQNGMIMEDEQKNAKMEDGDKEYKEILAFFEDLDPTTEMERLSTEIVFTRTLETYLINP